MKRKDALWTLSEGITQGMLNSWMGCPEQMALSWVDGLTPKALNVPLEFGSIMHYAIEHQFDYQSPLECILAVTSQYQTFRSTTLLHSKERDTLEFLLGLAEVTFPEYCRYWHEDDSATEWLGREEKFDVPYDVVMPDGTIRQIRLRGMRDGLYRIPKKGTLGLFETKNKSKIGESEIMDALRADFQTLFYIFVTQLERGELPEQVKYNVIRRSNKYQRKGETNASLLKRIAEDIKDNRDKKDSYYFKRFKVDLLPSEIKEFEIKTLRPALVNFILWWDSVKKNPLREGRWSSPLHYRNLNALESKFGKADMWDAIVLGSTRPYRVRSEVFPELEDSFQVTHKK